MLTLGTQIDDGNGIQMGQVVTVACRNVYGSESNYSLSLSSMATDLSNSNVCWGTGETDSATCSTQYVWPAYGYCSSSFGSSFDQFSQCANNGDFTYDCASFASCSGEDVDSFMMSSIQCECTFYISCIFNYMLLCAFHVLTE